jgi:hypothetical protein
MNSMTRKIKRKSSLAKLLDTIAPFLPKQTPLPPATKRQWRPSSKTVDIATEKCNSGVAVRHF